MFDAELDACYRGSFQARIGVPCGVCRFSVSTTPQMTCFRGAKVCRIWLQEKVTIN